MSTEVVLMGARCLPMRASKSSCQRCVVSCPGEAVTLREGPRGEQRRCVGGLLCFAACPTEALILKNASLLNLFTPLKGITDPVLACVKKGYPVCRYFHHALAFFFLVQRKNTAARPQL